VALAGGGARGVQPADGSLHRFQRAALGVDPEEEVGVGLVGIAPIQAHLVDRLDGRQVLGLVPVGRHLGRRQQAPRLP
jgi:hypothetical protein